MEVIMKTLSHDDGKQMRRSLASTLYYWHGKMVWKEKESVQKKKIMMMTM